jgi:hypothetical protein
MSDFELMINVAREINFLGLLPAKTLGKQISSLTLDDFDPCKNPSDAWPIIVENEMSIWAVSETDYEIGMHYSTGEWMAYCVKSMDGESCVSDDGFEASDQNPLRAAMICFLKMKDNEQ